MSADEVAKAVHRQVVVDLYSAPYSVDEELDDVAAARVVDWIAKLVLRVDLTRDDSALILHLELVMSGHCET